MPARPISIAPCAGARASSAYAPLCRSYVGWASSLAQECVCKARRQGYPFSLSGSTPPLHVALRERRFSIFGIEVQKNRVRSRCSPQFQCRRACRRFKSADWLIGARRGGLTFANFRHPEAYKRGFCMRRAAILASLPSRAQFDVINVVCVFNQEASSRAACASGKAWPMKTDPLKRSS